jgi:hypothetical protein
MLRCMAFVRTDVSKECSVRRFLVTANVPSSQVLVTRTMEALRTSETLVPSRATRRNVPENYIILSYRWENLKSYIPRK